MAKYAHQPIHLSSFTVSFSPTTDNAGISNSSLSKLNSLPYFIDTTENSYRLGPETYVPIPRGESYCQANGNWSNVRCRAKYRLEGVAPEGEVPVPGRRQSITHKKIERQIPRYRTSPIQLGKEPSKTRTTTVRCHYSREGPLLRSDCWELRESSQGE